MIRLGALISAADRGAADVPVIVQRVPELMALPPGFIVRLWEEFSEDVACAGSLIVDDFWLGEFGTWLSREWEPRR